MGRTLLLLSLNTLSHHLVLVAVKCTIIYRFERFILKYLGKSTKPPSRDSTHVAPTMKPLASLLLGAESDIYVCLIMLVGNVEYISCTYVVCQEVVSLLRFEHKLDVVVRQLTHCDYIVSNRMAVERRTFSGMYIVLHDMILKTDVRRNSPHGNTKQKLLNGKETRDVMNSTSNKIQYFFSEIHNPTIT